jgi:glycosyltransferase involved in cell wall biosynthesis
MAKKYTPSVSVIICTFNGEKGIAACLRGLQAQNYPANKFSIVVVDDGCSDGTVAIARSLGVEVVSHGINLGVQHARNTGLKAAKGDIVAYLDDDCVVEENWLTALVAPFTDPKVVAVGGRVIAHKSDRISERFMEATGYGNPEPQAKPTGNPKSLMYRLGAYIRNTYAPITVAKSPVPVQAVYTANVAYRVQALRAASGFDEGLRTNEDSDVATRLRSAGGVLMFAPEAIAQHRHHQRVWHIIRQTFYRAGDTLLYYRKNKMLPPIFPFPIVFTALSLAILAAVPRYWLAILLLPVLLYNFWVLHAIRHRKLEYVAYAYIQLAREAANLLGFARGMMAKSEKKRVTGSYATRNPEHRTVRRRSAERRVVIGH